MGVVEAKSDVKAVKVAAVVSVVEVDVSVLLVGVVINVVITGLVLGLIAIGAVFNTVLSEVVAGGSGEVDAVLASVEVTVALVIKKVVVGLVIGRRATLEGGCDVRFRKNWINAGERVGCESNRVKFLFVRLNDPNTDRYSLKKPGAELRVPQLESKSMFGEYDRRD